MRIAPILKLTYQFSTKVTPFQTFLNSAKKELSLKRNPGRNSLGSEVHVPHRRLSREEVVAFFETKDIRDRNILLNIDPSHLLGMRRMVSLEYLNANVYKGFSDPVDVLKKQNPSNYVSIEELRFDHGVFAFTDPLFRDKAQKEKDMRALLLQIEVYYNNNLQRGVQRLEGEYQVPPEYLHIIETAYNMGNRIFFAGLNEYELRRILTSYLSLTQLKILFMEALKHSASVKSISSSGFHHMNKEILWKMHYSFLQPINYQLLNKLREQIKGYSFAHAYNFIQPDNPAIKFKDLKDKEPDNAKLQKNAILEVLFGNLWTRPYTNNPFPYLAQSYNSLSADDKKLVVEIYNSFYNKYNAAKDKFRSNIV